MKEVFFKDVSVGHIPSVGDSHADLLAASALLKSLGLYKEISLVEKMFSQASSFAATSAMLYELMKRNSYELSKYGAPFVVNMAFCIELYLKTLGHLHGERMHGHDLILLSQKLPISAKTAINSIMAETLNKHQLPSDLTFDHMLEELRTSFVDWRYRYEQKDEIGKIFPIMEAFAIGYALHSLCVRSGKFTTLKA